MLCFIQFDDSKKFAEMKCKYVLGEDKANSGSLKTPRDEKAENKSEERGKRREENNVYKVKTI